MPATTLGALSTSRVVTLFGDNFASADPVRVYVGGIEATVTNRTSTSADVTLPSNVSTPGTVYKITTTVDAQEKSGSYEEGFLLDFADHWKGAWTAEPYIHTFARLGFTAGCGNNEFCPLNPVTRQQLVLFIVKARHGRHFVPPAPTGVFADVPITSGFARWVEQAYRDGLTAGCGTEAATGKPLFCPDTNASKQQFAVFLVKGLKGSAFVPPDATGIFSDVPTTSPFARYIEYLHYLAVAGGCGSSGFCPEDPVVRENVALYIVRAFRLQCGTEHECSSDPNQTAALPY